MKKVIVLVSVLCVFCLAGTALAKANANANRKTPRPAPHRAERQVPHKAPARPQPQPNCRKPFSPMFTPDMPKEIREKAAEIAKLRIDLEEAMTSRPLNREKALEVHSKMLKVKLELEEWKFAKRLERIEAMQKNLPKRNIQEVPVVPDDEPEEIPDVNPESDDVK
ncbi:MAG: hypothetical protein IJ587_09675 [Synergistaceae bacterium]|nr:hypothetical protein [Synergistaceae bacterium]